MVAVERVRTSKQNEAPVLPSFARPGGTPDAGVGSALLEGDRATRDLDASLEVALRALDPLLSFAPRIEANGTQIGAKGTTLSVTGTQTTAGAAPSPATNEQLGVLAARLDAERAKIAPKVAELEQQLARIEAALKDPSHADKKIALDELKTKYTKELSALTQPRDAAKKELDLALTQIAGPLSRSVREAAPKLVARIEDIDREITVVRGHFATATDKLVADTKAAQDAATKYGVASRQAGAAIEKARASGAVASALSKTLEALDHAKAAVTRDLEARQKSAFAEAKKAGDPIVRNVVDLTDFASDRRVRQEKVIGAPVVGVNRWKAVEADVERIARLASGGTDDGLAAAAQMLEKQLLTSGMQGDLVAALGRTNLLTRMAGRAQVNVLVTAPVLDALKAADFWNQRALGIELAKATQTLDGALGMMLDARMRQGDGFEEAYALERGLRAAGKTALADQLRDRLQTRLGELTGDFETKSQEVARIRGDLARLVGGFGPLLPAGKQQAAMDAFKARHASELAGWETAGAKLARASKFITENAAWNAKAAELLPDALNTQGGQGVLVAALRDAAAGLPTFLDAGVESAKDGTKIAKYLPTLVVKAAGTEVLRLMKTGRVGEAKKLLDTLQSKAGLLMVKPESLEKVIANLEKVVAGEKGALTAFDKELRKLDPKTGTYKALKALAWAASIATGVERIRNNDDLYSYVKGTAEILGPTAEIGGMTVELLATSERAVLTGGKVAKAGGGAFTAVGAVLDTISAVQSFRKGDYLDGGASAASALGGAILAVDALAAAAGMQVIPVWGQVAGAALIIGGTITKWVSAERKAAKAEKASEDDAQAYLEAVGIDRARADELSDLKRSDGRNVGMMIQQLAPAVGLKPKELWDKLLQMSPDRIDDFVDMTKDLVLIDGAIATTKRGGTDSDRIEKKNVRVDYKPGAYITVKHYPQSLPTAAAWTRRFLEGKE